MDTEDEDIDDAVELEQDELYMSLTVRERQVTQYLAVGRTNREIAQDLGISVKTVDTHRDHVLKKLGLPNNSLLVHMAIARGWVVLQHDPTNGVQDDIRNDPTEGA
jgi:DNA-binding CsgD family transcriptional regulator